MVNETLAEVLQSDQEVEAIRQETKETIQTLKQKNQAANQQAQAFEH